MPKPNVFLFVEPEKHYLIYGSAVIREIIDKYRKPDQTIIELKNGDANPEKINEILDKYDPIFFWGVGHGNVNLYTVECKTVYMMVCDSNTRKMAGRIIHLNSCLTAQQLGPDLVNNKNATAYFGSRKEFYFFIGSPPGSDRASKTVFYAEYQIDASLMQGKTVGEAYTDSQKKYDEEIEYWTTGPGKTNPYAAILVRILEIDKEISTILGNVNARITPIPVTPIIPVSIPKPIQIALAGTPIIIAGIIMGGEELKKLRWM